MNFKKLNGLVPVVVQELETSQVLMVGFMNEEAYRKTILTGYVTFWSRSRSVIWTKGETSGNTLEVVEVFTDCDDDTLLITTRIKGGGVCCHTGNKSCFYKKVMNNDLTEV